MPGSEKRIAASRANGAKSHGTTSITGRRNSSLNATKHGFRAEALLLDGESRPFFNKLLKSFRDEFQPVTPTDLDSVQEMAIPRWRSLRILTIETAGINHEMSRQTDAMAGVDRATRAQGAE